MKTRYWFVSVLAVCLLAACQAPKEIDTRNLSGKVTFHAVNGDQPDSKTVLQANGSVFWSPGDAINIFAGEDGAKLTSNLSAPAASADFSGELDGFPKPSEYDYWAVYPYRDSHSFDGVSVTLSVPAEQEAVAGTFGPDLFLAIAKTNDYTLSFYNVCGGVKFNVEKEGIKSVVFKGNAQEPLAGTVKVGWNAAGKPEVKEVVDAKKEIRLTAPKGGSFEPGVWYYIVALPASLESGFTLSFYADALLHELVGEQAVTIKRSVWGALDKADEQPETPEDPTAPEMVDLGLSVKWASCNLGAAKPEENGIQVAWGETEEKDSYEWSNYSWAVMEGEKVFFTKYSYGAEGGYNGFVDGKLVLDPEDDAATVSLGGNWRTPTMAEWNELCANCQFEISRKNGALGFVVTSEKNGNSIFLPLFYGKNSDFPEGFYEACYMSSKIWDYNKGEFVKSFYGFYNLATEESSHNDITVNWRCRAFPIRPVNGPVFRFTNTSAKTAVDGDGETFYIEVVSTLEYEISNVPDWIQMKSMYWEEGPNHYKHGFVAQPNFTGAARSAVIVFCNESNQCIPYTITQEVAPPRTLSLDYEEVVTAEWGGSFQIQVTSNANWVVEGDGSSWVSYSPASGSKDGSFTVEVGSNPNSEERTATLQVSTVDGQKSVTLTIRQQASVFDWNKSFPHKSLFMRFTADWCGYCPMMATAAKTAIQNHPDKIVLLNLHPSSNNSKLTFQAANTLADQYKIDGFPSGVVDGRRDVPNYNSTDYTAQVIWGFVEETEANYPVSSGIIMSSSMSGQTLDVDIDLKIKYAASYKLTVLLTESGIVGYQADYNDGAHQDYEHNDIARMALSSISGDAFTTSDDFSTQHAHYSVSVPTTYNKDQLKVVVYVQRAFGSQTKLSDGFGDYYVDNCVSVPVGEAVVL